MGVWSLGREDLLKDEMAPHSCLGNPMDRGAWQATVHSGCTVRYDWINLVQDSNRECELSLVACYVDYMLKYYFGHTEFNMFSSLVVAGLDSGVYCVERIRGREIRILFLKWYLFIYFWLCWVFPAARAFFWLWQIRGCCSLWCTGFLQWLLLLWRAGSRHLSWAAEAPRLPSAGSVLVEHGLSARQRVGSFWTGDRTCVSCIGRDTQDPQEFCFRQSFNKVLLCFNKVNLV